MSATVHELRVGVWPRPQGVVERDGQLRWASARPERAATPAGTAAIVAVLFWYALTRSALRQPVA